MAQSAITLEKMLISVFGKPDELRRFLRGLEPAHASLVDELPSDPVPHAQLVHEAARALVGRGLADRAFFAALRHSFSGRAAHIDALERTLIATPPPASLGRSASGDRRRAAPTPRPEPIQRPIRVLHLSDLHFSAKTSWDADTVLGRLAKDVAVLREERGQIDLVVLTGDVANFGRPDEYERARAWLTGPLAEATGRAPVRAVPGNHDVDRGAIEFPARAMVSELLRERDPQQALAEVLEHDRYRALLLERKAAWGEFATGLQPGLTTPFWGETLSIRDMKLHLAGLDSALFSASDEDRNRLMLGRAACNVACKGADEADLAIALLHHPFDWLTEEDRNVCEEELRRRCGLILHGHNHHQQLRLASDPDRDVLVVAGGAAYAGGKWPNGYQLLELDPMEGRARIHLRTWDGHDWIPDRNRYQKAPEGVASVRLRRSPRAPDGGAPPPPDPDTDDKDPPPPDPNANYRAQIQARADVLATVLRAPGGPTALSHVYVELRLSAEATELGRSGDDGVFDGTRGWMRRWLRRDGGECGLPTGRFKLEELVRELPGARLAVLGDPGGGKTTLLRHTALVLLEEGPWLPVLLKVAELEGDLLASVRTVYGAGSAALVQVAVLRHKAVLLLDGLDEVTDRDAALAAVRRVAAAAGRCPLVLASRPVGWQRPTDAFVELALCPLEPSAQRQLLDAWVPDDPDRVTRALRRLDASARLRRLGENPLLLTLVALLLREGEDIPERRGELYNLAVGILLTREADPQRAARRLREPDLAKLALAHAALRLHGRSEEVYRTVDLIEALQAHERHRDNVREIWGGPGAFLTEVAETTGLLLPTTASAAGAPAFAFPHRTFREHLAAVALERDLAVTGVGEIGAEVLRNAGRRANPRAVQPAQGELGRVLADAQARPERWSEVLALVCALMGTGAADALVRRLAAEGNLALLQRVVAEAEGLSSDTVLGVLGVERGREHWEKRQKVIQEIPALVGDVGVAVRLLDRLRRETRDGDDLWWIRETLREIGARLGLDPEVARDARETAERISDHIPPEQKAKALALMRPWWRRIPAEGQPLGPYQVGNDEYADERPVHEVTLTQPIHMLGVPVTWEMYQLFDPGHGTARVNFGGKLAKAKQDQVPVYNVTWYAASMFAAWVGARLPLEPEWELACRAGTRTRFWSGDTEADLARVGWYEANSDAHPHLVAEMPANPWGLHDMHGNVWEWCVDVYGDTAYTERLSGLTVDPVSARYQMAGEEPRSAESAARGDNRVVRGGSWGNSPVVARSASRGGDHPSVSGWFLGFRLVLPAPASEP